MAKRPADYNVFVFPDDEDYQVDWEEDYVGSLWCFRDKDGMSGLVGKGNNKKKMLVLPTKHRKEGEQAPTKKSPPEDPF
jgi:hypothetical protein